MTAPVLSRFFSASGVPLAGRKVVRILYLDESGTSPSQPILVVAGVIVHGDTQLGPIEDHLESLIEKHIPEEDRNGFYFHATDIFSGGKRKCIFHDRDKWSDDRRWAILDDLTAIPAMFDLPICCFISSKSQILEPYGMATPPTALQIGVAQHTMAIIQTEVMAEAWMRNHAEDEVILVTAENNFDVRSAAKGAHLTVKDKKLMKEFGLQDHPFFPFRHIKDGLQFADKPECRMLQIADVCAWAIRRAGESAEHAGRWYKPLMPQIIRPEVDDSADLLKGA